jgi:hypothetical protein
MNLKGRWAQRKRTATALTIFMPTSKEVSLWQDYGRIMDEVFG